MLFVAALALLSGGTPSRKTAKATLRTASPQIAAGGLRGIAKDGSCMHRGKRHTELVASADSAPESELVADELLPQPPSTLLLCTTVALQVSCFGVIAQALPVALMDPAIGGHSSVSAAKVLGTLASASALVELLVSGFFGRLSDAVGRKSTLVLVPLVAVLSRAAVVAFPSVPMLIVARFVTSASVPIFWLSFQASLADTLGRNATRLAIEQSRISAALGLGFAASTFVGGSLASRSVRLAYGCSCALGLSVVALVSLFFRETLPPSRRRPLGSAPEVSGAALGRLVRQPFLWVALFRRGLGMARFSLLLLLMSLVNSTGDIGQLLARELRGWSAAEYGRYQSSAGLAVMLGTLVTAPAIVRLGSKLYTMVASTASMLAFYVLGSTRSTPAAFGALGPMGVGAGRVQPASAKLTAIGVEQGVPQGQLAAERNTLNALVKVVAPSFYAFLFEVGVARGVTALPFYVSASLLGLAVLVASTIPAKDWR